MKQRSESPENQSWIPLREAMESRFGTQIVTYENGGEECPGGMCRCCGSGPNTAPDWRGDPWYVYRAGICDADGVYYSMLVRRVAA